MKLPDESLAIANKIDLSLTSDRSTQLFDSDEIYPLKAASKLSFQGNNFASGKSKNNKYIDSNWLPNLSPADKAANFYPLVSRETDALESNYQAEHLKSGRKPKNTKILVIEDCDLSRDYICAILQKENHQVVAAKDSETAIELTSSQVFDLIIYELMVPKIHNRSLVILLSQTTINFDTKLLSISAHIKQNNREPKLILIDDRGTIQPLTKAKLIEVVNHQLNMAIAR